MTSDWIEVYKATGEGEMYNPEEETRYRMTGQGALHCKYQLARSEKIRKDEKSIADCRKPFSWLID